MPPTNFVDSLVSPGTQQQPQQRTQIPRWNQHQSYWKPKDGMQPRGHTAGQPGTGTGTGTGTGGSAIPGASTQGPPPGFTSAQWSQLQALAKKNPSIAALMQQYSSSAQTQTKDPAWRRQQPTDNTQLARQLSYNAGELGMPGSRTGALQLPAFGSNQPAVNNPDMSTYGQAPGIGEATFYTQSMNGGMAPIAAMAPFGVPAGWNPSGTGGSAGGGNDLQKQLQDMLSGNGGSGGNTGPLTEKQKKAGFANLMRNVGGSVGPSQEGLFNLFTGGDDADMHTSNQIAAAPKPGSTMGFLDGLFDAGESTQKTKTQNKLPDWVNNAAQSNYKAAQNLASRPYQPYSFQRIAGFTGDQNSAMGMLRDYAPTAAANSGGNFALPRVIDNIGGPGGSTEDYMSPYIDNVLNRTEARVRQATNNAHQWSSNAMAHQDGAFGDARHGIADSLIEEKGIQEMGDQSANAYAAAYDNAMGLKQGDIANLLAAKGMNQKDQDQFMSYIDSLYRSGSNQQALSQNSLELAYKDFLAQRDYPVDQYNMLVAGLNQSPYETSSVSKTSTPTASPAAGIASTIGAIASML
eukprot:gene16244-16054_t